ncbi:unnamed protein product [Lampetra fluviatilis]
MPSELNKRMLLGEGNPSATPNSTKLRIRVQIAEMLCREPRMELPVGRSGCTARCSGNGVRRFAARGWWELLGEQGGTNRHEAARDGAAQREPWQPTAAESFFPAVLKVGVAERNLESVHSYEQSGIANR